MSLAQSKYGQLPMRAVKGSRRNVVFRPTTQGESYGPGSVLRIPVSSVDWLDPLTVHLNGRFLIEQTAGTGGTTAGKVGGIMLPMSWESLIDYVIVRAGGRVIDDVRDYAHIESFINSIAQSTDSVRSVGAICEGQTLDDADRLVKFGAAGKFLPHKMNDAYVSINLSCVGLLGTSTSLIPVRYLAARQPLELEIRFKATKDCFTYYAATGGAPVAPTAINWKLSEVYLMGDALDMDEVSAMYDQKIMTEPMVYPIKSWTHYATDVPQSSLNFTHQFNHPGEDLRMVVVLFENLGLASTADPIKPLCTSDHLHMPRFLQEASLSVGTRRFPEGERFKYIWKQTDAAGDDTDDVPITPSSAAQAYREVIKAFGRSGDTRTGFVMTPELWSLNRYPALGAGPVNNGYANDIDPYRTTHGIVFNLNSNCHEFAPDLSGTGLSTLSATTHSLSLQLLFSAARGAFGTANKAGGDYRAHIFCFTAENLVIYADRVEREIKLMLPNSS